jgi:hypothetical protein
MTESTRERVLRLVLERGRVDDPADLLDQDGDLHAVVHTLFMLRRAGLVAFKERRPHTTAKLSRYGTGAGVNGGRVPYRIEPTRRAIDESGGSTNES